MRRDPIDDRILRVLEKNATHKSRKGPRPGRPQASSRSLTPWLLALLPAGAVVAAAVALIGPLSQRRSRPVLVPASPPAAPAARRPAATPTPAPKRAVAPGGGAATAPAARANSSTPPSGRPAPAAAGREQDPPLPPARRAARPSRGWGHGSSAAPPPPPGAGTTAPAPGTADGSQERSSTTTGPAAALTALRITNPSIQPAGQPLALPGGSLESEGWIELEAAAPLRLQAPGASAAPAR